MTRSDLYGYFKDFAAPLATVTAAGVAAYFVRRQAEIADRQAEIAADKLRHDLFQERNTIHESARELIVVLANQSHGSNFDFGLLAPHYIVLANARYYFPDNVCAWLEALKEECQTYIVARTSGDTDPIKVADRLRVLLDRLTEMSKVFEPELEYRQLTRRRTGW